MLCNQLSNFPSGIDELIFFQDTDIDHIDIINQYNKLIADGEYQEANDYINEKTGIYGYFSDFLNAIENRIYNLQDYLLSLPEKVQPFVYYNKIDDKGNELEPTEDLLFEDMVWT